MPLNLDEAIARVPQWRDARDVHITTLGGGITNNNYRIDVNGESFVLRLPGANTELLGINRDNEYAANTTAGEVGIAPEVYYYIQPENYLVTRFIYGRTIPPGEIRELSMISQVMELVKKIHSMPDIPGVFNVFNVIRDYAMIAHKHKVEFPQEFDWLSSRLQEAEVALQQQPGRACPCHNDLLNANFLANHQLYILDWEYAGMGDPFFDLANFSDNHELSDEEDAYMLGRYIDGVVQDNQLAHLKIMKVVSNMREAAWGLVQAGISQLDLDFNAYADKFFNLAMQQINHPDWNQWLKEVNSHV